MNELILYTKRKIFPPQNCKQLAIFPNSTPTLLIWSTTAQNTMRFEHIRRLSTPYTHTAKRHIPLKTKWQHPNAVPGSCTQTEHVSSPNFQSKVWVLSVLSIFFFFPSTFSKEDTQNENRIQHHCHFLSCFPTWWKYLLFRRPSTPPSDM